MRMESAIGVQDELERMFVEGMLPQDQVERAKGLISQLERRLDPDLIRTQKDLSVILGRACWALSVLLHYSGSASAQEFGGDVLPVRAVHDHDEGKNLCIEATASNHVLSTIPGISFNLRQGANDIITISRKMIRKGESPNPARFSIDFHWAKDPQNVVIGGGGININDGNTYNIGVKASDADAPSVAGGFLSLLKDLSPVILTS